MYIRESGDPSSPTVLLLHGQMLDGAIFDTLAPRLSDRFRVLVPDLPGYGKTPLLEPYTLAGVREAIEAELSSRSVREVALVAYSLGTYHALAMALARRVPVTRLALLAPLAGADEPVREAFRGYAQAVRGGMKVGAVFAQAAIPASYSAAHADLAPRIAAAADAVAPATYVAEFEAIAQLADLRPRLAAIQVPTLIRIGDADQNIPLETARQVAAALPNATLETVPGCGHLYLEQDAEGTIASVSRFLGG